MKLTEQQKLLLGALLSMFLTALATALQAIIQKTSTNAFDVPSLINVGLVVFGTTFGSALIAYIPSHVREELDALRGNAPVVVPSTPPQKGSVMAQPTLSQDIPSTQDQQ